MKVKVVKARLVESIDEFNWPGFQIRMEAFMHHAHIVYKFNAGKLEEGVEIWKKGVYDKIQKAEGFIRVQLYTDGNEMMAIGSWKDKSYAEKFMKTGIFKDIMVSFGDLLEEDPVHRTYSLRYFDSKE